MADTVRDKFRSELQAIMTAASITWPLKDTLNNDDTIDAATSYITVSFAGGVEEPFSFGDPGNNIFRDRQIIYVDLFAAAGTDAATLESHARAIRDALRDRRFTTTDSIPCRIRSADPLGGGVDERLAWHESIVVTLLANNIG